ncbi:MAG: ATP-dependent RNA helicase HrpA [Mariprofundaceae bacterium]
MEKQSRPDAISFSELSRCMLIDRRSILRKIRQLRSRKSEVVDQKEKVLTQKIQDSQACYQARQDRLPNITFANDLPISNKRELISAAIQQHQVVIIAGETGSGKTTQLPKICLTLGRGIAGMIGHTQPRRIAARSVANRIAAELNSSLGEYVGYKIRFSDKMSSHAYIKLMTDGILLAEIQKSPHLMGYDTIIIDEAHERSLNIDFLLGYLKHLLPKRKDLKLIITSATINTERFSAFFNHAPIIEVSGRSYPVDISYHPLTGDEDAQYNQLPQAVVNAVDHCTQYDSQGDILVFLPGEREIRDVLTALNQQGLKHTEVIPLFSRLSTGEQDRVFQSHSGRRIVLATNVAETSLTVPGIHFVIDSGLARISRYSPRSKVQRLPIEPISQASAHQRAGRCGRVTAGICIRLYSKDDFENRSAHTDPEIVRTNLASVILQMANLDLDSITVFPFMDPPDERAIRDGYRLLTELQAVDEKRQLTSMGRKLIRLPIDPRMARMLVAADQHRALSEVLIITAALSLQDPRLRPLDQQQKADSAHRTFAHESSDFLSWLNLWNWYHEQAQLLSKSKLRKLCQHHFLSYLRMREWHDLHQQLLGIARELNMRPNLLSQQPASPDDIHRSLLAGLLSHVGMRDEEKQFIGARQLKFTLFPGSTCYKKPPKWVVASDLVETGRLYARTLAAIEPAWLERLAPHLIKREYSEPHWSARRAQVTAYEKLTLFGLPIVVQRRVHYGPIDPEVSRRIFIRHALVLDEYHSSGKYAAYNRTLREEIETLEAKSRRRDLMAEEHVIFDYFDAKIPEGIYNGKLFEQWRKQIESSKPKVLFLNREILLQQQAGIGADAYPDHYQSGVLNLKYSYHFDPTQKIDGVTLMVPLITLGSLDAKAFDWLVPGMLHEKVVALIKTLPKALRRNFVPAPQFAEAAIANMDASRGSLCNELSRALRQITATSVEPHAWQLDEVPPYLQMKFSIVDEQGEELAIDADLQALQHRFSEQSRTSLHQHFDRDEMIERSDITSWDFGALPQVIEKKKGSLSLQLFPALVDQKNSVSIQLFESRSRAEKEMCSGLLRLFMLSLHQQVKFLRKNITDLASITLHYAQIAPAEQVQDELITAAFTSIFMSEPLPHDSVSFHNRLDQGRANVVNATQAAAASVCEALQAYTKIQQALNQNTLPVRAPTVNTIKTQLDQLIYPGFITATPTPRLQHLPRFIQAATIRLEKSGRNTAQEKQYEADINTLWQNYLNRASALQQEDSDFKDMEEFRWLIEELRVSLFAQTLKTSQPVSVKRLEKAWQKVQG